MRSQASAILQARMGSSRLPGKVLADVGGRPLIDYQIEQIRHAESIDRIIVATSTMPQDSAIANYCFQKGLECFRGSEADVLARYYECATSSGLDHVVRLTADNPLQDPSIIDQIVGAYFAGAFDYVSNTIIPTFADGLEVEVFSLAALVQAHRQAETADEREHVTLYIKRHPELFLLHNVTDDVDRSWWNWTVDTTNDLKFVRHVLCATAHYKPYASYADIRAFLQKTLA